MLSIEEWRVKYGNYRRRKEKKKRNVRNEF